MKKIHFAIPMFTLLVLSLSGPPARAQAPSDAPGYFPTEYLDRIAGDELSIEINLQGAMLKMISAVVGETDDDFASLVAGLKSVHVRTGEHEPGEFAKVRRHIEEGQQWLEDRSWHPLVRIREEGSEIYIYTREDGDSLVGLTVLAVEETEVTAINLVGRVDPDQIARLMHGFSIDVTDLEKTIRKNREER